jgi:hypothetical protein
MAEILVDEQEFPRRTLLAIDVAAPDAVGLWGFAFATFLGNLVGAGLIHGGGEAIGTAVFLGGLAQLIAGNQAYKRRDLFGATAFTSFGLFWTLSGTVSWLTQIHLLRPTDGAYMGWYLLLWAIFVIGLQGASLKLNRVLPIVLGFLWVGLLLLAIGAWTDVNAWTKVGSWSLIISAVTDIYLAMATFWNLSYGHTLLTIGEKK